METQEDRGRRERTRGVASLRSVRQHVASNGSQAGLPRVGAPTVSLTVGNRWLDRRPLRLAGWLPDRGDGPAGQSEPIVRLCDFSSYAVPAVPPPLASISAT